MGQEYISPPTKKISAAKREGILWEASRQYMRGQISESRLREIESSTLTGSEAHLYPFSKAKRVDN